MSPLRFLLLQTRNAGDLMAPQEVRCFARSIGCEPSAIEVFDLLATAPSVERLKRCDMILLGGSGHYSAADVTEETLEYPQARGVAEWLERTLDALREIHTYSLPTFASCWGFQAMARAMGGRCVNDLPNAEIGTIRLALTEAGWRDPLFGQLPLEFDAQAGHEDHVVELPHDAVLLASSDRVREQAFCFPDKPIYCTQFHPELDRTAMLERVAAYPEYIERIAGISFDDFVHSVHETPQANSLLKRFVQLVFG